MKQLFNSYVQIIPDKAEIRSKSGFQMSNNDQQQTEIAEVVAFDTELEGLSVGDKIVYKSYSIDQVELDAKEKLSFIKFEDIIATL